MGEEKEVTEMSEEMSEVKRLTEPARGPRHCDRPMRKLTSVSASSGKRITVHSCEKCGHQEREVA